MNNEVFLVNMKKNIVFIIILFSFLFVSCESIYIDTKDVICTISDPPYYKDREIVFSISGQLKNEDTVSYMFVDAYLYKYNEYERSFEKIEKNIVSCSMKPYRRKDNHEFFLEPENQTFIHDFDETLAISITENGVYKIGIILDFASSKKRGGGDRYFEFDLDI